MPLSRHSLLVSSVALAAALAGCSSARETRSGAPTGSPTAGATTPTAASGTGAGPAVGQFSNLAGDAARETVRGELLAAGVPADRVSITLDHAVQLYDAVGTTGLATGFRSLAEEPATYDPYAMQDAWNAEQPEFPGYNCRLTAYTLGGGVIAVSGDTAPDTPSYDSLFMDHEAIDLDPAAVPTAEGRRRFDSMWTAVATSETKDVATHLAAMQAAWKERGVSFQSGGPLSVVSVVVYTLIDAAELFIGHTGGLVERGDGTLLFVEKLAVQEPYQATVFADRSALNDYLMAKYDSDPAGTDAATMVLEGAELIEGYRRVTA